MFQTLHIRDRNKNVPPTLRDSTLSLHFKGQDINTEQLQESLASALRKTNIHRLVCKGGKGSQSHLTRDEPSEESKI